MTECRKLLTDENIKKIAKDVVAICEAEKNTTNLKRLKELLSKNEKKYENTINIVMECEDSSRRKIFYEKLSVLEKEHAEIEKQIAEEEKIFPTLTVPKIMFFLKKLKDGTANSINNKKTLIDTFVNKIYLYDDKITLIFNSGDKPVTIDDLLLSEIEVNEKKEKVLFNKLVGPP